MLALIIHIRADEENEGGFIVRCDNIPNEDGPEGPATVPYERTATSKSDLKERVGDIAWVAITNFEAEEAARAKAHEEHEAAEAAAEE